MLSVTDLLNPAPSGAGPPWPRYGPSSAPPPSPTAAYSSDASSMIDRHFLAKRKMAKEPPGLAKSRAKGVINFRPFEDLDEVALREVRRFQIYPFGSIQDNCKHIPYNSGKKDFFEKTGRESFEVFQYSFKVPGDDSEYSVMWDYNVGLVRMTPFFKCCKYGKTMPAKMLNLNPGLRDITHSITGGSIQAQGYWMPFHCARAVCATFCQPIASALIPIFGPVFPSECIPPESPDYGRMVISPAVVAEAAHEAHYFRHTYAAGIPYQPQAHPAADSPPAASPRPPRRPSRLPSLSHYDRARARFKKGFGSPYGTDTDTDLPSPAELVPGGGYVFAAAPPPPPPPLRSIPGPLTPLTAGGGGNGGGCSLANHAAFAGAPPPPYYPVAPGGPGDAYGTNPWLSAVPRLLPPPLRTLPPAWHAKRAAPPGDADADYEYDAGESSGSSPTATSRGASAAALDDRSPTMAAARVGPTGAEKNAALLLMNLSFREMESDHHGAAATGRRAAGLVVGSGGSADASVGRMVVPALRGAEAHRSKRRRAAST